MNILFHRYGSICEPDIIECFHSLGLTVIEDCKEITQKNIDASVRIQSLAEHLLSKNITFVFSINFFPYISDVCERFHIPYVCWSVDCPVLELFSPAIHNRCNRIFLFDQVQYERIHAENPDCIFYLPLATNVNRWDQVLAELSVEDQTKYATDVSFVGSLYTEKAKLSNDFMRSDCLSAHVKGYIEGLINAQLQVCGYNLLEESLDASIIQELKGSFPDYYSLPQSFTDTDAYVAANYYIGLRAAMLERIRTLNAVSSVTPVTLYTHSQTDALSGVICRGGVHTLTEMPKVFHLSKINLNITIRPIQSGLSLRIWDILGCGGFLLSNYQAEIPSYLTIGRDLECYETIAELKSKVAYYLAHDDDRMQIAENGYQKVKHSHTYLHRIAAMMKLIFQE